MLEYLVDEDDIDVVVAPHGVDDVAELRHRPACIDWVLVVGEPEEDDVAETRPVSSVRSGKFTTALIKVIGIMIPGPACAVTSPTFGPSACGHWRDTTRVEQFGHGVSP